MVYKITWEILYYQWVIYPFRLYFMVHVTNIDILEITWSSWNSDMSWYSNRKTDDFTKVNKRAELTSEYAYNFYGFYLKKLLVWMCVFQEYRKPSPQTNYDSSMVKLYCIDKLKCLSFLSVWPLQKLETLRFPLTLSDKLGRLSH